MTKPHEETWSAAEVTVDRAGTIRELEARDRLASSAPEMARALLHFVEEWPDCSCGECALCEARTALTKAGVLP